MPATKRMTISFSPETQERLTRLLPEGRRTAFVEAAVREALKRIERAALEERMRECAEVMYDEIMALERDFHPLEEELHREV